MASKNARQRSRGEAVVGDETQSADVIPMVSGRSVGALPQASEELRTAVRETSSAVNSIMDQAETVMAMNSDDPSAYRAAVQVAMTRILEACAFEDLTGQRIAKAAEVLRNAEAGEACVVRGKGDSGEILTGPGLEAPHMSQAEVDAVFAD